MEDLPILTELMEIAGSSKLNDRMVVWFEEEAAQEGILKKLVLQCIEHLKRGIMKCRELIEENEALGPRGITLDCLDALRKIQSRHTHQLVQLIQIVGQTDEAIHSNEGFVKKMAEHNA